jgi:transglutaminase-like putative cysteine protease
VTDVHSPLETVLAARAGVCQDFAHLLIALVRSWGFPARYVMGYLDPGYIQSPDIKPTTHAWAEVLIPGAGWRGFDATRQLQRRRGERAATGSSANYAAAVSQQEIHALSLFPPAGEGWDGGMAPSLVLPRKGGAV